MHCLVTGGAGFIGSNIVEALLERGDSVTVLDDLSTGNHENIQPFINNERFSFIMGSISDPAACREASRDAETVFHEAAFVSVPGSIEDPAGTADINVRGTVNVFDAAREAGVRTVVWASSTAVYGNTETLPNMETMPLMPLSPYAASKAAGEMFARAYCESYRMHIVGLRYFNVFGRRQDPNSPYAAVIPLFINRILAGIPVIIYGDGGQTRDFVHVENVVAANLLAAASKRQTAGNVYNIGCGERISVNRLYEIIADVLGCNEQPRYMPPRTGEVRDSMADISAARRAFGYNPEIDVTEGLKRTVAWYREHYNRENK